MNKINQIFWIKVKNIYVGWKVWHRCIKKYHMKQQDAFIVIPSKDKDINEYVLKYLDEYLMSVGRQAAIVLVTQENNNFMNYSLSKNIRGIEVISVEQMQNVISYYSACNPDARMLIADIDCIPIRKRIRNLIGVNDLTLEEVIAVGIYRLDEKRLNA